MTTPPKDPIDNILDFILSDDSPLTPEDKADAARFDRAIAQAEQKLAQDRLARARAGVLAHHGSSIVSDLAREKAKRLVERARSGDRGAQLTLAARFGDGSMNQDMDAVIDDIAELLNDQDVED